MSTTNELAAWLDYARLVSDVLPIDEEADRMATSALNRRDARTSTKLVPLTEEQRAEKLSRMRADRLHGHDPGDEDRRPIAAPSPLAVP